MLTAAAPDSEAGGVADRGGADGHYEQRSEQMAERAAIVTGASSGIGLAIARVLGEEGYALTLAARRPEKLEAAAEELAAEGFECRPVAANVSEEAEIQKVVAAHRERYGRLDVLVNNAGVGFGAPVGEIQTKRLDMQLDINLRSIVLFYRECGRAAQAGRRRALATRSSSTPPRSPASAARAGCRCTRPPSTASSAGPKR